MNWWKCYDSAFAVKWREPQRFRWLRVQAEMRELGSTFFLVKVPALCFGLLTPALLIACFSAPIDPAKKPFSFVQLLLLTTASSVLLAGFLFLAVLADGRFFHRTVVLARTWMGVIWEAQPRWEYSEVAQVRLDQMRLGEEEFRVMVVTPREGKESTLAVSSTVDPRQIAAVLRSKGIEVVEKT